MDLITAHVPEPLPQRLRRLAELASEADVYGSSQELQSFEAEVAQLLGKPAGLFFATGGFGGTSKAFRSFERPLNPSFKEPWRRFVRWRRTSRSCPDEICNRHARFCCSFHILAIHGFSHL